MSAIFKPRAAFRRMNLKHPTGERLPFGEGNDEKSSIASRIHADRAPGGDRDHRGPDCALASRRAGRTRGGEAVAVRQQPEAIRPGDSELRHREGVASARRQHPLPGPAMSIHAGELRHEDAAPPLPRADHTVQLDQLELHRRDGHGSERYPGDDSDQQLPLPVRRQRSRSGPIPSRTASPGRTRSDMAAMPTTSGP